MDVVNYYRVSDFTYKSDRLIAIIVIQGVDKEIRSPKVTIDYEAGTWYEDRSFDSLWLSETPGPMSSSTLLRAKAGSSSMYPLPWILKSLTPLTGHNKYLFLRRLAFQHFSHQYKILQAFTSQSSGLVPGSGFPYFPSPIFIWTAPHPDKILPPNQPDFWQAQ